MDTDVEDDDGCAEFLQGLNHIDRTLIYYHMHLPRVYGRYGVHRIFVVEGARHDGSGLFIDMPDLYRVLTEPYYGPPHVDPHPPRSKDSGLVPRPPPGTARKPGSPRAWMERAISEGRETERQRDRKRSHEKESANKESANVEYYDSSMASKRQVEIHKVEPKIIEFKKS
jgi:hypothetical protein